MNLSATEHLTDDELLTSAVDLQAMASERRTHLSACTACRQKHDRLSGRLERLGRMARQFAPTPARPFRLPEGRTASRSLFLKPSWVAGFSAVMLLTILVWQPQWRSTSKPPQVTTAVLAQDRQLMQSIDSLVEDALPAPYRQLVSLHAPVGAEQTDTAEDFMDWLVPPANNDRTDESLT